jgi:hypothetical protein
VPNRGGTYFDPIRMSKKTIAVDSKMIDLAVDELSKLMVRLDKNPKKTRKDQNTIKKIQEIRDTIQDSVLYAKLKKSIE